VVCISEGMQQEHEYVESQADLGDCETAGCVGEVQGPPVMDLIPVEDIVGRGRHWG
jgi:hypothetical protein